MIYTPLQKWLSVVGGIVNNNVEIMSFLCSKDNNLYIEHVSARVEIMSFLCSKDNNLYIEHVWARE